MKASILAPIAALLVAGLSACSSTDNTGTSISDSNSREQEERRSTTVSRSNGVCHVVRGDTAARGRNVLYRCNGHAVLNSAQARAVLDAGIPVSFGSSGHAVRRNLISRQAGSAAGSKSDETACERAFINAAKRFQDAARKHGANRVSNFHSYFDRKVLRGGTYECEAGSFHARVVMRGDVAR